MSVPLSWLIDINVIEEPAPLQPQATSGTLFIGIFPVVTGWTTNTQAFTSYAAVSAFFTPLIVGTTTTPQNENYKAILGSAQTFFSQTLYGTPTSCIIGRLDPTETAPGYATALAAMDSENSNYYAVNVCTPFTSATVSEAQAWIAAVATLPAPKQLVITSNDVAIPSVATTDLCSLLSVSGASKRANVHYSSKSFPPDTFTGGSFIPENIGAAICGTFYQFPLLTVGQFPGVANIAGQQLVGVSKDVTITGASIDYATQKGANIYFSLGSSDTTGVGCYEFVTDTRTTQESYYYFDNTWAEDYMQGDLQVSLADFILENGPSYDDIGFVALQAVVVGRLEEYQRQGVIEPITLASVGYVPLSQVPLADRNARIYRGLSATVVTRQRIQRITMQLLVQI